jgi:shikimate dehydrogenase
MTAPGASQRHLVIGSCQLGYRGDDATRILGVLGHPVQQSLSPVMQQAALDAHDSNVRYLKFAVTPSELPSFMEGARRAWPMLVGFNVTVPHKMAVAQRLDSLAATAQSAGAVNTVVIDSQGHFQGHNTDIAGLRRVWQENNVVLRDRALVIVGAGGLSRAAVVAGFLEGAGEIRLANRTVSRAQSLLDELASRWQGRLPRLLCTGLPTPEDLGALLSGAAVLVQATSLGMHHGDISPLIQNEITSVSLTSPKTLPVFVIFWPGATMTPRACISAL